ncbi:MAG: hypothetical protein ACMUEM_03995 [Flavobacteriales bacterium AspAUS03]
MIILHRKPRPYLFGKPIRSFLSRLNKLHRRGDDPNHPRSREDFRVGRIFSKVAITTVIPIGNYGFFDLREKKYILSQEAIDLIYITKNKNQD